MKNLFLKSLVALALIICAAGVAPAAHAQFVDTSASSLPSTIGETTTAGNGTYVNTSASSLPSTAGEVIYNAPDPIDKSAANTIKNPDLGESGEAFGETMTWIMSLFAWLVGVAAITLNYAVFYTVVTMGTYVENLSAVGVTWNIMRDIGNIILIFGFLAIGISIILSTEKFGYGKKMLPMLLIAAVFLNFSLFISMAVIDTGNLFATQFYTQIVGGTLPTSADMSRMTTESEGISNKIMAQLGLQTIYDIRTNTALVKAGNSWIVGFMGIILFLITAFVMFSLAFILIARFVILLLLIIVAPIGFAGLAVPKLKGLADQWWSKLFEQTITAPVLLLLLYIALAVITDVQFLSGICGSGTCSKNWAGFVEGNDMAGFASMMLSFLVAMGLLLAVVVASKKMSAFGGAGATKLAGKLSFGAVAFAGRHTAGRASNALARVVRSNKLARVPLLGSGVLKVLDRGAKSTFDVRNAAVGDVGFKSLEIDAGKVKEGGIRKLEEEAIKAREEHARKLTQTSGERKEQETEEDRKSRMEDAVKKIEGQNNSEMQYLLNKQKVDIQSFNQRVDDERKKLLAAQATGNKATIDAAQLSLNNALLDNQKKREEQNKEREELKRIHDETLNLQKEELEVHKKRIEVLKRAPQEGYAKNLEIMPWGKLYTNSKAAGNIRKTAGLSTGEKDVRTLMNLIQQNISSTQKGGTPPPAGGGTPGP